MTGEKYVGNKDVKNMRILLAAPFVGEFGWELFSWQGYVRRRFVTGGFDEVVVLTGPGRDALYDDMPAFCRVVDMSALPGIAYNNGRLLLETKRVVSAETLREAVTPIVEKVASELGRRGDVEILWPSYACDILACDDQTQTFHCYHRPMPDAPTAPWIVSVRRTRDAVAANWSIAQWESFENALRKAGVHVTVYPEQAEQAIAALSHCDLAVGQSTGGLHLASLCNCPHVVWSAFRGCRQTPWEITISQRYETFWNPFGTPVRVHDLNRLPEVEEAVTWSLQALKTFGRRTGQPVSRLSFRGGWRLRNWLVHHVVRRPQFRSWPWTVQQFVRYQLI